MANKTLAKLLPIIIGMVTPFVVAKMDLGNKVFRNSPKAQEKRVAEKLAVPKHELYKTPLGNYYTSRKNLTELFMLAGYDAGTVDGKKDGYFDPEAQKKQLLTTCINTDDGDNILTLDEINKRLKDKYGWNPRY